MIRRHRIALIFVAVVMASCVSIPLLWRWHIQVVLQEKKQYAIDQTLQVAYPGAIVKGSDANLWTNPNGETIYIGVLTTFETASPFSAVQYWYADHRNGGNCGPS